MQIVNMTFLSLFDRDIWSTFEIWWLVEPKISKDITTCKHTPLSNVHWRMKSNSSYRSSQNITQGWVTTIIHVLCCLDSLVLFVGKLFKAHACLCKRCKFYRSKLDGRLSPETSKQYLILNLHTTNSPKERCNFLYCKPNYFHISCIADKSM